MNKMDHKAADEVRRIIKELGEPVDQRNLFAATFNRIVNLEAQVQELKSCIISLTAREVSKNERE